MELSVGTREGTPWYWSRTDVFSGLARQARGEFLGRAEMVEFKKGRHIFRSGDRATHAFLVQSGMVRVYDLAPEGQITVFWFAVAGDIMSPGTFNGVEDHGVNAQAVTNSTAFAIKRSDLEELMLAYPGLAINFVKYIGARLRLVSEMIVDSHCLRSEVRLARLLMRLAEKLGQVGPKGVQLPLRISHQELADMIGACRQTVNTNLRRFEREGLILMDGRSITISDGDRLLQEAGFAQPERRAARQRPGVIRDCGSIPA